MGWGRGGGGAVVFAYGAGVGVDPSAPPLEPPLDYFRNKVCKLLCGIHPAC